MTAVAKVNDTVAVRNPETFEVVTLHAGDDVPSWAEVGEHLTSTVEASSIQQAEGETPEAPVEGQGDEDVQAAVYTPDESWTNADIKQYADDHGIDLGGATTKADMLAVIG